MMVCSIALKLQDQNNVHPTECGFEWPEHYSVEYMAMKQKIEGCYCWQLKCIPEGYLYSNVDINAQTQDPQNKPLIIIVLD